MASKGREVLRGLAGLAGKFLGADTGQLLEVVEGFSNVLEGAAAKAPRKRAPSKRKPLELVAGGAGGEEPPRQVSAAAGDVLDVEFRAAPPAAKARPVEVTPRRRR